jgi:transglutaminase-like putative cysteine protease
MNPPMVEAAIGLRNVVWLTAALAMVTAPHAARLPWWIVALVCALALWRLHIGQARSALPRKWLLLTVVAGATAGIILTYRTLFGRDAGVALLIVMMGLKLMETRSRRDGMVLIFIGYFVVITNFLYSQTILTALYMLACVWVITAAMIELNHELPQRGWRPQFRTAGALLAQSVPLTLVLFLLFPRVHGPLWGLPHDAFAGVSGLSETMSPGTITQLTLSDAVAFRVEFAARPPEQRALYWRGPVMWNFDGRTWTAQPYLYHFGELRFESSGAPIEYHLTLEPHNNRWLFALDIPGVVPPFALPTRDFQLRSRAPVNNRVRYAMTSYPGYTMGRDETPAMLPRALQLPPEANPRAARLSRQLRERYADDRSLVEAVLAMLRNEQFRYTLEPPPLGAHPVDEFLFETKSGFCEHYASAFAVLMRGAGIPARVVTGYMGGQMNPLGGYMIVRQEDAHAWTEVWLQGEGWVRVDPTAAVAPIRVESGISAAVPRSEAVPLLGRGDYALLQRMRFAWDSLANTWNQWVLGYGPERQRQFLSRGGIDDASWRTLALILLAATGMVVALLLLVTLRKLRARTDDPAQRAYLRFCAKLARRGLPRGAGEGPLDYSTRLAGLRPDLAETVAAITRSYVALRYGGAADPRLLPVLLHRVRRFSA